MKKRSRALIIKVLAAPFLLFAKKGVKVSLYDAIYTRQSVDRIDSISVESQAEFCKKEVISAVSFPRQIILTFGPASMV